MVSLPLQCVALLASVGWLAFNVWFFVYCLSEPKTQSLPQGAESQLDGSRWSDVLSIKRFGFNKNDVSDQKGLLNGKVISENIGLQNASYRNLAGATSLRMHGVDVGMYENGTAFWVPGATPHVPDMAKALKDGGGFNLLLSDAMSLDRNVTESRSVECRKMVYHSNELTQASVVIVFYNEPFSTLFRSVHSVLHRTPPELLKEIILVDDGSTLDWIRLQPTLEGTPDSVLDRYARVLRRVCDINVVRVPKRKGIVGARLAGIAAAQAPVFVILDSHIEVQSGWLQPLVSRIKADRRRVVMPQVDGINAETFEPSAGGVGCTLGFLWKLIEHSFDVNASSPDERRQAKPHEFITSPTMAGGLFAADTAFFKEVGSYDDKFVYWGTENLELSFRLWMCGGMLECTACSRVYHIFRKGGVGYASPMDAVTKNKMRLLTIWMDEFADLAWRVIGQPVVKFGPIKENMLWRKERHCKSFRWFLENVNPEAHVRKLPEDVPYLGTIKNMGIQQCVESVSGDYPGNPIGLKTCHTGHSQQFMFFKNPGWIMPVTNDETCLGHDINDAKSTGWCAHQRWDVTGDADALELRLVSGSKCLGATQANSKMGLEYVKCDHSDMNQRWQWTAYNPPKVFTPPPIKQILAPRGRLL
eukprot:Lankesteria_metandrocarpae@DN4233_c0_g1_i1.p1